MLPRRRPPGLDSLITNRVVVEVKFCEGFVDAQRIGQGLEEMQAERQADALWQKKKPKIIVSEGIPLTSQETIFSMFFLGPMEFKLKEH